MPDPALLALVQHFTNPPPAIVQPAPMTDAEPFLSAYEATADEQERSFEKWLGGVAEMRRTIREELTNDSHSFTPQMFDDIIGPFEHQMRWQKRVTARLERKGSRQMSPRMRRLRERTLARQRRQYEAADGLVQFLRDVRREVALKRSNDAPTTAWSPNATTIAAIREADDGGLPRFATVADLMADLHAGD
ncbi:MAG: hypothetical protein ACRYGP_30410 [Janthinobacterium lividum]